MFIQEPVEQEAGTGCKDQFKEGMKTTFNPPLNQLEVTFKSAKTTV